MGRRRGATAITRRERGRGSVSRVPEQLFAIGQGAGPASTGPDARSVMQYSFVLCSRLFFPPRRCKPAIPVP